MKKIVVFLVVFLSLSIAGFSQGEISGGITPYPDSGLEALRQSLEYVEYEAQTIRVPDVNSITSFEQFQSTEPTLAEAKNKTQYLQMRNYSIVSQLDIIEATEDLSPSQREMAYILRNRASTVEGRLGSIGDGVNAAFAGLDILHMGLEAFGDYLYVLRDDVAWAHYYWDMNMGILDGVKAIGPEGLMNWYYYGDGVNELQQFQKNTELIKNIAQTHNVVDYGWGALVQDWFTPGDDPLAELNWLANDAMMATEGLIDGIEEVSYIYYDYGYVDFSGTLSYATAYNDTLYYEIPYDDTYYDPYWYYDPYYYDPYYYYEAYYYDETYYDPYWEEAYAYCGDDPYCLMLIYYGGY